jgi:benzoyl-CoA reductase subunit D
MTHAPSDQLLTAGIDIGSAVVKIVLVRTDEAGGEALVAAVAAGLYRDVLAEAGVPADGLAYVATTGEAENVPFRTGHFYGMTTHARGGLCLEPDARAIIDMGALHTRAVAMDARG